MQWIDQNYPGTVYSGTAGQMAGLEAGGGCPLEVHVDLERPAGAAEEEARIVARGGLGEEMPINLWERKDAPGWWETHR